MNINLKQIQAFIFIYESGSFTEAAKKIFLTQPAVSKLVADLEEQVGFKLFNRTTRRVFPTDAAEEFYVYAVSMIASLKSAQRSINEITTLQKGKISLAASPLMIAGIFSEKIALFRKKYPNIHFDIYELSTEETISSVLKGKVDLGFASLNEENKNLLFNEFRSYHIYAAFNEEKTQIHEEKITKNHLKKIKTINLRKIYSISKINKLITDDIHTDSNLEVGTLTSALGLARSGLGIVIIPGYVTELAQDMGLKVAKIQGYENYIHKIQFIQNKNITLPLSGREFKKFILKN